MKDNSKKIDVRRACTEDAQGLLKLLEYILNLHFSGRPDIFKNVGSKYGMPELKTILSDEKTPVFAAVDEKENVVGYAFCIEKEIPESTVLQRRKVLYVDDLCVDESCRGLGVGGKLMEAVKEHAQYVGATSIELNVWGFNHSAISFYEHLGFKVQKSTMEIIL